MLGGGNALGAYHWGVADALADAGVAPQWLVGASIGAVTAAILAGNGPETRLDRLAAFWRQAAEPETPGVAALPETARAAVNNWFAVATLAVGRPGLFRPRLPGLFSLLPFVPPDRAIGSHRVMAGTLERLVDFDRLNDGPTRVSVLALDVETGEEVWFDTARERIGPRHILASAAFLPLFPPVEVNGRLLCDAGFANNTPLDRVFAEAGARERLCIAVDLFDRRHGAPRTLDEVAARVQDIALASQTRRSIAAIVREREAARRADPTLPPATIAWLAQRGAGHERALKSLDFSAGTLAERVRRGRVDAGRMLALLDAADRTATTTVLELAPAAG